MRGIWISRTVPETSAECSLARGTWNPLRATAPGEACSQLQVIGDVSSRSEQVAWARFLPPRWIVLIGFLC